VDIIVSSSISEPVIVDNSQHSDANEMPEVFYALDLFIVQETIG
jgi:hypothetical protein